MRDLDAGQSELLHRWFQALNGPRKLFYFDFTDPNSEVETRYVVRFREPRMASSLIRVDRPDIDFTLIEEVGISLGGDI